MIGSTLDGRYRIDAVLGMGGMGCVYRGVHTGLQRPFAIKVLETQSDRATIESFRREAFASGQLDHPNIIAVSDFGALEDGSMFLAMELLDGESLRTRLDRDGVLAWTDAIEIMRGMLSGLGYAHDREIVHCDVKPENIFLARKHGDVFVKLLDFGIARLLGRSSADDLTHGTPDYVCPEQAKREEITAASDIYSASVVLYEMIAGSPPFAGITAHEKLHAHVHDQVPPFESDLKVPPRLEELVRKGLAKDPKLRVVSAHDFVHQIDDLLLEMGLGVLVEQMSSPFAMPRTTTPRSIERAPELPRTVTPSNVALPPEGRRVDITTHMATHKTSRRVWMIGGGMALALAGTLYAVWPVDAAAVAAPTIANVLPAPVVVVPDPLLDRAALAIDQGRITSPPGENAFALIAQAGDSPRATSLRYRAIATLRASAQALWNHGKKQSARTLYVDLMLFSPGDVEANTRATVVVEHVAPDVSWLTAQIDLAIIDHRLSAPPNHNALEYLLELRKIDPANPATVQRGSEVAAALTNEASARPKDAPALRTAAKQAKGPIAVHDQSRPWLTKGRAELSAGNYDRANADFQRAVAVDSTSDAGFAGLAEVAYNRADFTRAAISGKRSVELAPSVIGYRMTLAKAYYKLMRFDDAIAQWQRVLELDPKNVPARQNIQTAKSRRGV